MQNDYLDTDPFDPSLLQEQNLHYGTPSLPTLDSQGWHLAESQNTGQDGQERPCVISASSLTYNVVWKLQVRKGRMMTLTGDTVEDVDVVPGIFWNDTFKPDLDRIVQERAPEPQYRPDETRITVSTSKRAQRDFQKTFKRLAIDWNPVANKLQSWCSPGHRLTVDICFIFKEISVDPTNKVGKTGRGASARQLAARDKYIAQQEAAGIAPVWKDIYALFDCTSVVCPNRGFFCWREPTSKKHHKLDTDLLEKIVEFAEDGNKVETQNDMPERLRELIYKREEEDAERKLLKRKANDPAPTTIRLCCSSHDDGCHESRKAARVADPGPLKFPMPMDQAPVSYCDWLCSLVTNDAWRVAYRLACDVVINKGYHLGQIDKDQTVNAKMLVANGVLQGIAVQFVGRIREWLDAVGLE